MVKGFAGLLTTAFAVFISTAVFAQDQFTRESERLLQLPDAGQYERLAPVVSPDSRRLAYKTGSKYIVPELVIVDGQRYARMYDAIFDLGFSPDGKRIVFGAREKEPARMRVVLDGKEGKGYDRVAAFVFSPDSKRFMYVAKADGKWAVVIDGQEEKAYEDVLVPVFSPDGRRTAYRAFEGRTGLVVVDGKEGKRYSKTSQPVFSPDSAKVAYLATPDGSSWFLVLDGKEQRQKGGPPKGDPLFSPDGNHIAYTLGGTPFSVAIDGVLKECDRENCTPVFSPDSSHFAYNERVDKKVHVVLDGQRSKKGFDAAGSVVFSPDSRHFAFVARVGSRQVVVINGVEGQPYDPFPDDWRFENNNPIFSPDSQRIAFRTSIGNRRFVVVNGMEVREYDDVGLPVFSPDGKHVAYWARKGRTWCVVVDGKEGMIHDRILTIGTPGRQGVVFDSADSLHYLAARGGNIYLVERR